MKGTIGRQSFSNDDDDAHDDNEDSCLRLSGDVTVENDNRKALPNNLSYLRLAVWYPGLHDFRWCLP